MDEKNMFYISVRRYICLKTLNFFSESYLYMIEMLAYDFFLNDIKDMF